MNQQYQFAPITELQLSHSSRKALHSCERKFEFRKLHESSGRTETFATSVGSAYHTAWQTYLATGDRDQGLFELIWDFPIKYQKSAMEPRSLEAAVLTYLKTTADTRMDEFELAHVVRPDTGETVPAIEVPFQIVIPEYPFYPDGRTIRVVYIGFMDLIMYNKLTGDYTVWDIKTTTKVEDHDIDFHFDEQCLPYGLVLESLLGKPVANSFEVSYWVHRLLHLDGGAIRYPYMRGPEDVQDWTKGFLYDLDTIRRYYNAGWFPRKSNACGSWNRTCPFFSMCETRDPNVINQMLQGQDDSYVLPAPWITVELKVN